MKIFFKKITYFFVLFLSLLFIFSIGIIGQEQNQDQETQEILATVNNIVITLNDFNQYWNAIPEQYKMQLSKADLLEQIVIQTLLVQKADEIKLSNASEVQFQIKNATEQILIQYLIEKEIIEKTEINDDEFLSYYEENKDKFWKEEEVHALNVYTETEEQATEVLTKLSEGIDFSVLAQEASVGSSASRGGDIGFISKGTLTAEIEDKLFVLNPGEISEIIPTDKGFHIFKVLEKNPAHYLELGEVKEEIKQQLLPQKQQQTFDQYLKDIEEQATVVKHLELISDEEPDQISE